MWILDQRGLPVRTEDVDLAEEVIKLRNKKDPWVVIDLLVHAWIKKAPEEVEAQMIQIDEYKEDLIDKKYATTREGYHQERRFKLVFPKTLMLMIRCVYSTEELPFTPVFHNEFAKRYPYFKIAEKL